MIRVVTRATCKKCGYKENIDAAVPESVLSEGVEDWMDEVGRVVGNTYACDFCRDEDGVMITHAFSQEERI